MDNSSGNGNTRPPYLPPKATEPDMKQWTGSKLGKEYIKGVYHPCLFKLYAEYIRRNARLDEAQAGKKIAGKISITSDKQMTPPLRQTAKKN